MTTFTDVSYGEGVLGPLAAQGGTATLAQGIGSMLPLTAEARSDTYNFHSRGEASLLPLSALAANKTLAQGIGSMLPLTAEASDGEILPDYAIGYGRFNYLLSAATGYTPAGYSYNTFQDPYGFSASGHAEPLNGFVGTLPFLFRAHFGGWAKASLAAFPFLASGTVPVVGRAALTMPLPEVLGAGMGGSYGRAALRLSLPTVRGQFGAWARGSLPKASASASATAGGVGRATLFLPFPLVEGAGLADAYGRAVLTMPMLVGTPSGIAALIMPRVRVVAYGGPVVVVEYEAYAATIPGTSGQPEKPEEPHTYALTRFENYPFDQIIRIGRDYYGVASDGLYRLGGRTDNGVEIPWVVRLAKTSFGTPAHKTVGSAYLGGRLQRGVTFRVIAGEDRTHEYRHSTPRDEQPQNYRQHFGKGIKATYYAFELADPAGRYMELDSCEFEVAALNRRI